MHATSACARTSPPTIWTLVHRLGIRTTLAGVGLQLATGLLWAFDLPAYMQVFGHPLFWLTGVLLLGVAIYAALVPVSAGAFQAYAAMALYVALALLVAIDREALRVAYMAPFHYDINQYKVHPEWWAFAWFAATLLGVGGSLVTFYGALLWKAGKVRGLYTADRTAARLGDAAVWINGVWLAAFFVIGFWAYLRNVV
jgi:hypothetical protein